MQEVRAAFLLQRSRYGVNKVSHKDALRWATKGSAACTGRTDIGEIAVGKMADLALFKLDELRFSGSGDPLAALVLCGAHRADRVMVGGRWTWSKTAQIPGLDTYDADKPPFRRSPRAAIGVLASASSITEKALQEILTCGVYAFLIVAAIVLANARSGGKCARSVKASIDCNSFIKNSDGSWTVVQKVLHPGAESQG